MDTDDKTKAEKEVSKYCDKLLANPNIEDYEFTLSEWTPSEEEMK